MAHKAATNCTCACLPLPACQHVIHQSCLVPSTHNTCRAVQHPHLPEVPPGALELLCVSRLIQDHTNDIGGGTSLTDGTTHEPQDLKNKPKKTEHTQTSAPRARRSRTVHALNTACCTHHALGCTFIAMAPSSPCHARGHRALGIGRSLSPTANETVHTHTLLCTNQSSGTRANSPRCTWPQWPDCRM